MDGLLDSRQITLDIGTSDGEQSAGIELNGVHTPENKAAPARVNATEEVYQELQVVYDEYNRALFDGELPGALIVLTRKRGSGGHYSPGRYTDRNGAIADEISLNPELFPVKSIEEILSILVHEQAHQWQFHFGLDVKSGYHNMEYSKKMESIGLITSSTGYPGGDRVGERMAHYIAEDGPFIVKTRELLQSRFGILWFDRYPKPYLRRAPNKDDIQRAEDQRKEVQEEKNRMLAEQGKKPSNRGRKRTPVVQVEPAKVSKPAILVEEPLAKAIGGELVDVKPVTDDLRSTVIAARLIRRQEARAKTGKRIKYSCPSCHDSVWGKNDMQLICGRPGCNHARMGS